MEPLWPPWDESPNSFITEHARQVRTALACFVPQEEVNSYIIPFSTLRPRDLTWLVPLRTNNKRYVSIVTFLGLPIVVVVSVGVEIYEL